MAVELSAQSEGSPAAAHVRPLPGVHAHVRLQLHLPLERGAALQTLVFADIVRLPVHPQRGAVLGRLPAHVAHVLPALGVRLYVILEMTLSGECLGADVAGVGAALDVQRAHVAGEVPAVGEPEAAGRTAVAAPRPGARALDHPLVACRSPRDRSFVCSETAKGSFGAFNENHKSQPSRIFETN